MKILGVVTHDGEALVDVSLGNEVKRLLVNDEEYQGLLELEALFNDTYDLFMARINTIFINLSKKILAGKEEGFFLPSAKDIIENIIETVAKKEIGEVSDGSGCLSAIGEPRG